MTPNTWFGNPGSSRKTMESVWRFDTLFIVAIQLFFFSSSCLSMKVSVILADIKSSDEKTIGRLAATVKEQI